MHERLYLVTDWLEMKWLKTLDVHLNAIFGNMGNDIYKLNVTAHIVPGIITCNKRVQSKKRLKCKYV